MCIAQKQLFIPGSESFTYLRLDLRVEIAKSMSDPKIVRSNQFQNKESDWQRANTSFNASYKPRGIAKDLFLVDTSEEGPALASFGIGVVGSIFLNTGLNQ